MPIIPDTNRGYTLAFFGLGLAAFLCAVVLFKTPNQFSYVMGYFKDLLIWMVPIVIGAKEGGKIAQVVAGKFVKPPVQPTTTAGGES